MRRPRQARTSRSSPSSTRRTPAPRRKAAISAGPTRALVAPFTRCAVRHAVGEIPRPSRPSTATTSSVSTRSSRARPRLSRRLARSSRPTCAQPRHRSFGEIQEQLQSGSRQPGADLDALAKEFKLQTGDVPQFLNGAGRRRWSAPQLQELVFGDPPLATGHMGGPVLLGDDRLVLVKVLEPQAEPKPVAEVHDDIVSRSTRSAARRRL